MSDSPPFSQRTNWSLSPNPLITLFTELKTQQTEILNLTESNPTVCDFQYPSEDILRPLAQKINLHYTPDPKGNLVARKAISNDFQRKGFDIPTERIFLTASTSEAYGYLFRLLANPKDRMLFPQPSYPLFQFLGDLNDLALDFYSLRYEGSWGIDMSFFKKLLTEKTKAILCVNPNNPTGSFVKKREQEVLNDICMKRKLSIISDEVFWDFSLTEDPQRVSFIGNKDVLTFTLGGLSKTLALPQMKLSWIIINGPDPLVKEAMARLEMIADTYLSVNTPTQNALKDWLAIKDKIQDQVLSRLKENLDYLDSQLKELKDPSFCRRLEVEGGWYAVLKIPDHFSEEEWALKFLKEDQVFIHPGYFFDFPKEAYIVVSLLISPKIFAEGLSRILKKIFLMK